MRYDDRTALVVVDVQNDFSDPAGSLYVPGGEEVVAPINDEIRRARSASALVVYTQDWHPEETPHFADFGGVWPVHCVAGTWGAEFNPALEVDGDVVQKGVDGGDGYSGFSVRDPDSGAEADTRLENLLRAKGIERVVIAGLATDYCVKETAVDAAQRGFETVVLQDATRAVNLDEGDGRKALEAVRAAGARLESVAGDDGR